MKNFKASYFTRDFNFRFKAKTSRNTLTQKRSWFILLSDGHHMGIGEASPIWGLSPESESDYQEQIELVVARPQHFLEHRELLRHHPSIQFALETAIKGIKGQSTFHLHTTPWTLGQQGQKINGLVWMGDKAFMVEQVKKKLEDGFTCLKLKVGSLDHDAEISIIRAIRNEFSASSLEIRLDANGAFGAKALGHLQDYDSYEIHSVEQPIAPGNWTQMRELCASSPIPIALDEELIGVTGLDEQVRLLDTIKPAFLILKPSLLGGTQACDEWIDLAKERTIGWWATSMLESDLGLNAIAQWVSTHQPKLPQGLGTGQLFSNNIPSPLNIRGEELWYNPESEWELPENWSIK
jgi:o-succinylbenzoate synthase